MHEFGLLFEIEDHYLRATPGPGKKLSCALETLGLAMR